MSEVTVGIIALVQLVLLTILQGVIIAFKEKRDAKLLATQKEQDAELRAEELTQQYAREDQVAKRLEKANQHIADKLESIEDQSIKIHTLVNSDMTAARSNERDQTKLLVVALKQVQSLNNRNGIETTQEELDAITEAEARIEELNQVLADRLAAQETMERSTE